MWLTILLGFILAILILILIGICCDSDVLENMCDWISDLFEWDDDNTLLIKVREFFNKYFNKFWE